jgi:hypothetical protein
MLSAAMLALVLGLPADAPTAPAVAEAPLVQGAVTHHWALSLSTGRSFYDSKVLDAPAGSVWQASHRQTELRVVRQGTRLVFGAAIHRMSYPSDPDQYAIGGGAVFGAHHPLASWVNAELDVTLGLQRTRRPVAPPVPDRMGDTSGGTTSYDVWFVREESGSLELYARLSGGVALRAATWLDIPVGILLHTHPVGETRSLVSASVGLRCLMP